MRWCLEHCSNVDDAMLALVSPEAYRLLRQWQLQHFGGASSLLATVEEAKRELLALGGVSDSELARMGISITTRVKGLWSTFHKAAVRRREIHDVLALRIVLRTDDDEECYRALAAVRGLWGHSVPGRFKDYVAHPKANGYAAVHDTVILPCGAPLEVQIRTTAMHRVAEVGSAAHCGYKGAFDAMPRAALAGFARLLPGPLAPPIFAAA